MRKNLLTQILLSFLALALLASASPAQSHRVHEGDSARCNSEDNKNQN